MNIVNNYPSVDVTQLNTSSVNQYVDAGKASSTFFKKNGFENNINSTSSLSSKRNDYTNAGNVLSLTGEYVDKSEFMLGSMTPYFGSQVKGATIDNNNSASSNESRMDNMTGNGSQVIRKIEQAPLFKPEKDMQWANGTPNMSNFIQERMFPGNKESNVKPFESEYVGPGLNQGYGSKGSDGFNSGMAAREDWMPKSVDELRVETNPKMEYSMEGLEGPSYSHVQNLGKLGIMEKNRPERAWEQSADQWLTTTTADHLGPKMRSTEMINNTARNDTTTSYTGIAVSTDRRASYPNQRFLPDRRVSLETMTPDFGPANLVNRIGGGADKEMSMQSYTAYGNNRTTTRQQETFGSGFTQAFNAAVLPFLDMFNATKREEYTNNVRIYGDAGSTVPGGYMYNKEDKPDPTIRDMTMYAPGFNVNNQSENSQGAYMVADMTPTTNQRDTTQVSYTGDVGGSCTMWGPPDYSFTYKTQTNNELKEGVVTTNRPNHGSMQIFNQQMNVSLPRNDNDRDNNRIFVPQMMENAGTSKEMIGSDCTNFAQKGDDEYATRIEPGLLDAFRSNPYTQSLASF